MLVNKALIGSAVSDSLKCHEEIGLNAMKCVERSTLEL